MRMKTIYYIYILKSIIFCDMTPCSLSSFNRRVGETYRLHLQGRRNKFSKNQHASHLLPCWFLLNLFLRPWRWRRYVPPKRRLKLDGLHVISQKMILFITTAVKTSNPTIVTMFLSLCRCYSYDGGYWHDRRHLAWTSTILKGSPPPFRQPLFTPKEDMHVASINPA
jgi:hypothetical protein